MMEKRIAFCSRFAHVVVCFLFCSSNMLLARTGGKWLVLNHQSVEKDLCARKREGGRVKNGIYPNFV